MGYQVLARKYRPQRFADVAGQDHVTRTLLNALKQNRVAHGYIFSGHRGIGKTTIARILAQALNCHAEIGSPSRPSPEPCGHCNSCTEIRQGNSVDVIEIDAATNRGIDEIRELRESARYAPARDRYKIFIFDEAHQITEAAFNALLKTLEEPPAHIIFMMATTEPENIPSTIRSRCQNFSFHAVRFHDILAQLKKITAAEDVETEDEALALLAEAGDGSMRDALSILDQAIASAELVGQRPQLRTEQIRELIGILSGTVFEKLFESVAAAHSASVMEQLNLLLNAGHSPLSLARQMIRYLRNALMAKIGGENTELLQISADERARVLRTAHLFTEEELTRNLQILLRAFDDLHYRQEQRLHLELGVLKLIHAQRLLPIEELLSAIAAGATSPAAVNASTATHSAEPPSMATSDSNTLSKPAASAHHPPKPTSRSTPTASHSIAETSTLADPLTEGALAVAPETQLNSPLSPLSLDALRQAVVAALAEAGHRTAAQMLSQGDWQLNPSGIEVTVPGIGKKMLELTLNAAAEKTIRQQLQQMGAPARLKAIPGAGTVPASTATPPVKDSVQELALQHPLVQRAQELFHAEIRHVLDLRSKA